MTKSTVFLVPAVLLSASLLGCNASENASAPDASPSAIEAQPDQAKAANLPHQAPPPRIKRSTAELLIGKWRVVGRGNPPKAPRDDETLEFTIDGKFHVHIVERNLPPYGYIGTHALDGKSLCLTHPRIGNQLGKSWTVTIESITSNEFVIVGLQKNGEQERVVLNRIPAK